MVNKAILTDFCIKKLKPYANNYLKHDSNVEHIINSIKDFGYNKVSIGIDEDCYLLYGHGTLQALNKLNYTEVPYVMQITGLTDNQKKAYRIADNESARKAEIDFELLNIEVESFEDEFNLEDYGFDFPEAEELEIEEDDYDCEPPEEPKSKLGDIYSLGSHRLMCGDSTLIDDVEKLMGGDKAELLFTSPPYSDMRDYNGGKNLEINHLINFISTYFPFVNYQVINIGIQRKNHEIFEYWNNYIKKAKECGYKFLAWNVWKKQSAGGIGNQIAFIPIIHEWIFVFGTQFKNINRTWEKRDKITRKNNKRKRRQKDGSMKKSDIGDVREFKEMESVIELNTELGKIRKEHPATFPVELPMEYIKALTNKNDNIIEPFGGSGSTLIACEQLSRKCYIMELDPKYCDVIIARYEKLTSNKAELING